MIATIDFARSKAHPGPTLVIAVNFVTESVIFTVFRSSSLPREEARAWS